MRTLTLDDFREVHARIRPHLHETPLRTCGQLSELTGYDVRLKAEMLQRVGSFKIRGPLNMIDRMSDAQKARGVICSSAGNHAQGVALAATIHGAPSTIVMAENGTPSKIAATRAYGGKVVLAGRIWDEANAHALALAEERGLTFVHPFDDEQIIAGQGTLGLEICDQWDRVDAVIVPIGGGGLIAGVAMAVKAFRPGVRVIGVESSDGPAMSRSVEAGRLVTLDQIGCVIDGLRVKRCGENTFDVVRRCVDEIVTVPDAQIFEAMVWIMSRCKLVAEGAAAAPVAALLQNKINLPSGTRVACVLSGGNVDLSQLAGVAWN